MWNGLVPSHVMLQFDIPDLKEAEVRCELVAPILILLGVWLDTSLVDKIGGISNVFEFFFPG